MERLDKWLVEQGLCKSREQAQAMILAGEVWADEERLEKPGMAIPKGKAITIRSRATRFVSRGGEKLEFGLNTFGVKATGRVCLDVGSSTGGFTDCLLKQGARRVFAVDVGYGQLDSKLRDDPRVTVLERTNARYLTREMLVSLHRDSEKLSLCAIDVSFISLRTIIPPVAAAFPEIVDWVLLFKPQFEVGRDAIGKGGLVKDQGAVDSALAGFALFLTSQGFTLKHGPECSPLTGKKSGNVEYVIHYERRT